MPSQDEIYTKVSATLVEALNVDEEDIKPTATLQGDLGAESIDFLDIVFRLEREFGISIPRGELFPESVFQGDPDFDQDRRLTAVPDLFTVGLVVRYVEWKLGKCVDAGPNGAGAIPLTSSASSV